MAVWWSLRHRQLSCLLTPLGRSFSIPVKARLPHPLLSVCAIALTTRRRVVLRSSRGLGNTRDSTWPTQVWTKLGSGMLT